VEHFFIVKRYIQAGCSITNTIFKEESMVSQTGKNSRYKISFTSIFPIFIIIFTFISLTVMVSAQTDDTVSTPNPDAVTVAGSFQKALGCDDDWLAECELTHLTYDSANDIWTGTFDLPAGEYEYKAALNDAWDENYGLASTASGDNIPLSLAEDSSMQFFYDHKTHWITDNVNSVIATAIGNFQTALGCAEDSDATCLRSWLQDEDNNGGYNLTTTAIPAGDYEVRVALNQDGSLSYGKGGQADGDPVTFAVPEDGFEVTFGYSPSRNLVTARVKDPNEVVIEPTPEPTAVVAFAGIVTAPGSYQGEIGCPDTTGNAGDWEPACLTSQLTDEDGDGIYTLVVASIPAGEYEFKIAVGQAWSENYGADGVRDGANIPLSVPVDFAQVTISFDSTTKIPSAALDESVIGQAAAPPGSEPIVVTPPLSPEEQPEMVVIPGTIQTLLGCEGDWVTECEQSSLTFDQVDNLWQGSFDLPAGSYEYKVAINGTWDENYGANGEAGGANIPLNLDEDATVKFYYDHQSHQVVDSINGTIVTAAGSFQSELGCPDDWSPDCLRSILQDTDGDGLFLFATDAIPAGDYEVKAAVNESWDENYGVDGEAGGSNIAFTVPADGTPVAFIYNNSDHTLTVGVEFMPSTGVAAKTPDLAQAKAHWVTADTIAWGIGDIPVEGTSFKIFYAPEATLDGNASGFAGGSSIDLTYDETGLSADVLAKFPHLEGLSAFKISADDLAIVPGILKSQAGIAAIGEDGTALDGTALQIPGVLDDLYRYDGALGVTYDGDIPTLAVWAPTAQRVQLNLFDDAAPETEAETIPMELDRETGVWSVTGDASWTGKYYLYAVKVYAPAVQDVVTNRVTDPYSFSLSMNSTRSQIVNLSDSVLQPEGWADLEKPTLETPEDIVLYELHVRDFSINDTTVPEDERGTFIAFTETESDGMKHLIALAQAGLTHIHLLPAFDIATINENAAERQEPDNAELAALPSDSEEQQAILTPLRDLDAFNWGYDPLHYTVPEGSYSTNPDSPVRIVEFRQMVQALNQNGLRVVMDVVYNHTNSSGQGDRSVLDRVVPGYYHRLGDTGLVATSTCCANTATEHHMMEKLMIDSLITWATQYKVDGFRFDLMGHHMRENMENVRAALDALTIENSGVNGKSIYLYGEGWDFGEVQGNALGINATQLNMGGTGIGTFNDRMRDAVRGGSPFGDRPFQGFISGLSLYSNGLTSGTEDEQRARMLLFQDQIRIGLAGNLRDYELLNSLGDTVTGGEILYNGSPTGYTLDPQEHIIYIAAHDNETLWDILEYKQLPDVTTADLVRIQKLGHSIVMLSQGIPFFHAGEEMLRSKSMDRNSYNSGDWFNRLDFTYQSNNWGVGLPFAGDNQDNWPVMQPLLANPDLKPTPDDIMNAVTHFQEMLQIRKSSRLFRLETAEDIQARLTFPNVGPDQIPGLIVVVLADDVDGTDLDPNAEKIVVLFNASRDEMTFTDESLQGLNLELHPVLANSADAIAQTSTFDAETGTFTIPGVSAAVFVLSE
jgi:pullulanase